MIIADPHRIHREAAYEEAAGLLKPSESKRPKRFENYHSSQISSYFRNSIQARYLKHVLYGIRTANGFLLSQYSKVVAI
ncbi:hypothetical protein QNH26_09405 [Peribacillus frigoritolerans]|uniref:hypothetical protein n=1 Tax=Peribacillus frigoritolerans TaxID=450367 RepID=UPI0024C15E3B|nr:hypothetical protein [Peribacillus frigoritolerans]WHX68765.1 hypothetical protein QNH26_09405 [Peribacillus frigoritolerans]